MINNPRKYSVKNRWLLALMAACYAIGAYHGAHGVWDGLSRYRGTSITERFADLWTSRPVPYCKIIDGREINDHHCIPYCPPDPKECG